VQEVRSAPWYACGTSTPANEAERLACTVVCAVMCVRNSQNRCEPKLVTGKRPAAQTKGIGARGVRSLFSTDLASFFAHLLRGKISIAARRHDTWPGPAEETFEMWWRQRISSACRLSCVRALSVVWLCSLQGDALLGQHSMQRARWCQSSSCTQRPAHMCASRHSTARVTTHDRTCWLLAVHCAACAPCGVSCCSGQASMTFMSKVDPGDHGIAQVQTRPAFYGERKRFH